MKLSVRIMGTAGRLPGRVVTTDALVADAMPDRDPAVIVQKTGIRHRHWIEHDRPLAEVASEVLQEALERAEVVPTDLDRIILANCTGAEWAFPASSNMIADRLGLSGSCDCFDVNNACMGFLTIMDIAARSIATGMSRVALVAAELCSRHIRADEPRPYLVFGDGVAAAVLGPGRPGEGILASYLANDGSMGGNAVLKNANVTNRPETIQFLKTNKTMTERALNKLRTATFEVLKQAGLRMDDIQWVLPHQPNGSMLDRIMEELGVSPERTIRIVDEAGSVGSTAIPISLDRLFRTRPVAPGDHILMVGVGSGVSFGSVLYRVASS